MPLLFCIIVMFNKGVEGGETQSISGYDCSSTKKSWDAATRCKVQVERKLEEKEVEVQLRDVPKCFLRFSDNGKEREEVFFRRKPNAQ